MITLDAIQLPDGLLWTDEFTNPLVHQSVSHSLGGRQFVQAGTYLKNRTITLSSVDSSCWMLRGLLKQLKTLASSNATHTLVMHDGQSFQVRWNYEATEIQATLIKLKQNPDDNDLYTGVKLSFIQV